MGEFAGKWIKRAVMAAVVVRAIPLLVWPEERCVRDECTYLKIAFKIVDGEGMNAIGGWLWAPGYPMLMALHKWMTGFCSTIKGTQIGVAALITALLFALARRLVGEAGARKAVLYYVLSPVMIFFTLSMWSETFYTALLLGALLALYSARTHTEGRRPLLMAVLCGALVGGGVLFRGVALYMVPIFGLGFVWQRWKERRAWLQAVLVLVGTMLVVSPYSIHASEHFDATVISDRTLGQMMWLGNNNFEPITFDYGNGALSQRAFDRATEGGREPCANKKDVINRDSCSTAEGFTWIIDNPKAFLTRMPIRVAQLVNPHSLLTRHLRWGKWKGLPMWGDEVIIAWGALWSMSIMLLGTLGLAARARGPTGVVIVGILLYHVAAIAALAGLSRYRVPLEPLLMIYAGSVLVDWRGTLAALRQQPLRLVAAIAALAILTPLVLWYLPTGWVWWRRW